MRFASKFGEFRAVCAEYWTDSHEAGHFGPRREGRGASASAHTVLCCFARCCSPRPSLDLVGDRHRNSHVAGASAYRCTRRTNQVRSGHVLLALERLFRLALMVLDFGRVINLTCPRRAGRGKTALLVSLLPSVTPLRPAECTSFVRPRCAGRG